MIKLQLTKQIFQSKLKGLIRLEKPQKEFVFIKSQGKIRYDFLSPVRDEIVSNGKFLWIYLRKSRVVGVQSLKNSKVKNDKLLYTSKSSLKRLFRKYHYKFNSIEQPRLISKNDDRKYFVLLLEQREKVGGYEKIILYVNASNYFIQRAISYDGRGKQVTFVLSNVKFNLEVEEQVFNYKIPKDVKTVKNPLVTEE